LAHHGLLDPSPIRRALKGTGDNHDFPKNINQVIAQAKREREHYIASALGVGALPTALVATISLLVAPFVQVLWIIPMR